MIHTKNLCNFAPKLINMEQNHKVKYLIIRFSSIGDIVLTTPVVRMLKQQVENAEIHYLTKPQFKSILDNNPFVDKIHVLTEVFDDMIKELEDELFDYIIDLHNNLRTMRVKKRLKLVQFSFDKLNWKKWLIVNLKINKLPDIHIVDRYLNTCKVFDINNDNKGLDYFIKDKNIVDLNIFPKSFGKKYIAIAIGAQHFTKRMPDDKLASVCSKIKYPIILLGDKNDKRNAENIIAQAKQLNNNIKIMNACGDYNLDQSASIVKQAQVVITHDTGLMHIAAAFKKKIISIWGNTIPEFGMYPYLADKESKIIEVKELKCRPCSKIGFRICPKKHFKCMYEINEEKIIELTEKMMNNE